MEQQTNSSQYRDSRRILKFLVGATLPLVVAGCAFHGSPSREASVPKSVTEETSAMGPAKPLVPGTVMPTKDSPLEGGAAYPYMNYSMDNADPHGLALKWEALGPIGTNDPTDASASGGGKSYYRAGRVSAIRPISDATVFIGMAGAGVWRTTSANGMVSLPGIVPYPATIWTALQGQMASPNVFSLDVAPNSTSRLFAGTGNAGFFRREGSGAGVLASSDAGTTWTQPEYFRNAIKLSHLAQPFWPTHVGAVKTVVASTSAGYRVVAGFGALDEPGAGGWIVYSDDHGVNWQPASITCAFCKEDLNGRVYKSITDIQSVLDASQWVMYATAEFFDKDPDPNVSAKLVKSAILKSEDQGRSWTETDVITGREPRIAVSASKPERVRVLVRDKQPSRVNFDQVISMKSTAAGLNTNSTVLTASANGFLLEDPSKLVYLQPGDKVVSAQKLSVGYDGVWEVVKADFPWMLKQAPSISTGSVALFGVDLGEGVKDAFNLVQRNSSPTKLPLRAGRQVAIGQAVIVNTGAYDAINGLYKVTGQGSQTAKWTMVKSTQYDQHTPKEIDNGGYLSSFDYSECQKATVSSGKIRFEPLSGGCPILAVAMSVSRGTDFGTGRPIEGPSMTGGRTTIFTDPTNDNNLLVGKVDLYRSTNGGNTFTNLRVTTPDESTDMKMHSDVQSIVPTFSYATSTTKSVLIGTDGGIYRLENPFGATNKIFSMNKGINSMLIVEMDASSKGQVSVGMQDNGSWFYENGSWRKINSCDGASTAIDTANNLVWTSTVCGGGGTIRADTIGTFGVSQSVWHNLEGDISIGPRSMSLDSVGNMIVAGYYLDANSTKDKCFLKDNLCGARVLTPTFDGSSPELQVDDWIPMHAHTTGVDPSTGEAWLAGSTGWVDGTPPSNKLVMGHYNLTDRFRGLGVHFAGDYPKAWDNGVVGWVSTDLAFNKQLPGAVWVSLADAEQSIWKKDPGLELPDRWDNTLNWKCVGGRTSGLSNLWVMALAVHPYNPDMLFAGTKIGLLVSMDGGKNWGRHLDPAYTTPKNVDEWSIGNVLPVNVEVRSLKFTGDTLYVGTYGRGVYRARVPTYPLTF